MQQVGLPDCLVCSNYMAELHGCTSARLLPVELALWAQASVAGRVTTYLVCSNCHGTFWLHALLSTQHTLSLCVMRRHSSQQPPGRWPALHHAVARHCRHLL